MLNMGDRIYVVGDTRPVMFRPDESTMIVSGIRDGLPLGRVIYVADHNGQTSTGIPRRALCLVPQGHIGNPCRVCGRGHFERTEAEKLALIEIDELNRLLKR
jgi:hypothetical protein